MGRPWHSIEAAIQDKLRQMAAGTAKNVSTVGAPPAGKGGYQVDAKIYNTANHQVATGSYTANDNMHAEISAIGQLTVIGQGFTIKTNKEPCYRCAAILSAFRVDHGWTVVAPKANALAPTYSGGYAIPNAVLTVVINRLVALGAISNEEATDKSADIKSFIASGDYQPKL